MTNLLNNKYFITTYLSHQNIILSFDSSDETKINKFSNEFYNKYSYICSTPYKISTNKEIPLYKKILNRYNTHCDKPIKIFNKSNLILRKSLSIQQNSTFLLNFLEDDIVINLDLFSNMNDVEQFISDQLKSLTQYEIAEKILKITKDYFKDNLKLLILAGSSGKCKNIKDWSDIDIYCFLNDIPHTQMIDYTNKLKDLNNHIDTTFYSVEELYKQQLCERAIVTIFESNNHNDIILYQDINIPTIPFKRIKKYNKEEIFRAMNDLKRQMYVSLQNPTRNDKRFPEKCEADNTNSIFNISRIIKAENFVKKLLLRDKNIFAKYSNEVDFLFCKYLQKKQFPQNVLNNFSQYNFKYIIEHKQNNEIIDYIINQGFTILDIFSSFNIQK